MGIDPDRIEVLGVLLRKHAGNKRDPVFPVDFPDPNQAVKAIELVVKPDQWNNLLRAIINRDDQLNSGSGMMPLPLRGELYHPNEQEVPIHTSAILGAVAQLT